MGFSNLRVINDDIIAGQSGFPTHPHENMEILTYIVSGAITHKDSTGTHGVISPGEIQLMSAGSGIRHSEMNDGDETVKLFQIWIEPNVKGTAPGYQQTDTKGLSTESGLKLLVSEGGEKNSLKIKADVKVYQGQLTTESSINVDLKSDRSYWLQLVKGSAKVSFKGKDSFNLEEKDAVAALSEDSVSIFSDGPCEFLLLDLPTKL